MLTQPPLPHFQSLAYILLTTFFILLLMKEYMVDVILCPWD